MLVGICVEYLDKRQSSVEEEHVEIEKDYDDGGHGETLTGINGTGMECKRSEQVPDGSNDQSQRNPDDERPGYQKEASLCQRLTMVNLERSPIHFSSFTVTGHVPLHVLRLNKSTASIDRSTIFSFGVSL
jgi:hypothetical protein